MLTGPIINAVAVMTGGAGGALLGDKVSQRIRTKMPMIFGLAAMGLGLATACNVSYLPAIILSLIVGSIIGEAINLENRIEQGAVKIKGFIEGKIKVGTSDLSKELYMEQFVSLMILFCASSLGIFGAMNEGMTGDPSMLITKSFLDLFTAGIFAISLGLPVLALAIPQFIIQIILYFCAQLIIPLATPEMIVDFSAVGGLILFATGFRICGILPFPVASMLPALLIIMPISHLWVIYAIH